jgi:hypothetical protein
LGVKYMNRRYAPMVGPSKILTVSYGTFSCTLEGFDDPFSTMKAIAEYFRDLAADDRYFGAEPPQPDAAMLHRIAEREVHRRVEARVQDNGVILRAADAPQASAPPMPAPSYAAATPGSALSESVAAKLQRLRAASSGVALASVVDMTPIVEEVDEVAPATASAFRADPAPVVARAAAPAAAPEVAAAPEMAPEAAAEVAVDKSPAIEPVAVAAAVTEHPLAEAVSTEPAVESPVVVVEPPVVADVAETLAPEHVAPADASATVAFAEPEAQPSAPMVTDEVAADTAPQAEVNATFEPDALSADDVFASDALIEDWSLPDSAETDLAPQDVDVADDSADDGVLMASLAAALAEPVADVAPDNAVVPMAETPADGAVQDALLSALIDDDLAEDDRAEGFADLSDTAPSVPYDAEDAATDLADTVLADEGAATDAVLPPVDTDSAVTEAPAPVIDTPIAAAPTTDDLAAAIAAAEAPLGASELAESSVSAEKLQRARARVIKIRRAEPAPVEAPAAALTPEAEADLARELEALKAEVPAVRPQLPEPAGETAVQRLIDQANTELDGAENRRRHAAIAHLKAAVAATVADRRATGSAGNTAEAERINVYRDDLERVVRPRRPVPVQSSGEAAPAAARPAPLVLVSAQRIDRPKPASPSTGPVAPVRPRRVAGPALALSGEEPSEDIAEEAPEADDMTGSTGSFAEFAERLGAQELPDLLEAAVAYAACVEGRPHVSRPYMLRHVGAVVPGGEDQRDAMLRSFGKLLRVGRLEKARNGQYTLPGSSRVMAEARKLAV